MKRWLRAFLLAVPALALLTVPASAQTQQTTGGPSFGWNGWGVRAGVSSDPDQVYGGVHFELGEFARDVRFRPSVEIGFGDDLTLLQGNAEVHYVFSKVQVWKPYVGGAVVVQWADPDPGDSETDFGLMGIGGVQTRLRSGVGMFFELKIGLTDEMPDFKAGIGWSWK